MRKRVRFPVIVLLVLLCAALGSRASADESSWVGSAPKGDGSASWRAASSTAPPRWRVRLGVASGGGGAVDGTNTGAFPTAASLAVRVAGPLSVVVDGMGVISGHYAERCHSRSNAFLGDAGLRLDFGNRLGGSWLSPFVEAHLGGGAQEGDCRATATSASVRGFASGGGSVGLDTWLGKAAVSVALAVDYLPTATPVSGLIGLAYGF